MKADFYVGLGAQARWLGSTQVNGAPAELDQLVDLFNNGATQESDYTEDTFVQRAFLAVNAAKTLGDGQLGAWSDIGDTWPHDHDTSVGTDFAYAWNNGCIHVFEEGYMVAQYYPNGARRPSTFPSMVRQHPPNPRAGS
jgi:hypothetical protein